jgi:hypothetical protein
MAMKNQDFEFEEVEVAGVHSEEDGWTIERSDGWSFHVPRRHGVEPLPGMIARFYGRGIGAIVRGLDLDGQEVFYKTPEEQAEEGRRCAEERDREQRAEFERNREDLDAKYDALPEVFRRRIDKFRGNNPDFRWEFEPYEMSCCEDAVKIAGVAQDELGGELNSLDADAIRQWFEDYETLPWEEQMARVPGLFDGHSGNSFGCAVFLARVYLTEPEGVVRMYGALAPLVGSEKYGCVPRQ